MISQQDGSKLYVANTGPAYPVHAEKKGNDASRLDFTGYGADYNITAPSDAIDLNTLGAPTIVDGISTVGVDIPAGTYRTTDAGPDCYWEIRKSGKIGVENIIDNQLGGGPWTVKLSAGQDFESDGCGTWKQDQVMASVDINRSGPSLIVAPPGVR